MRNSGQRSPGAGFLSPSIGRWIILLVLAGLFDGRQADAQFLRLGPFDFTSKAWMEGVYTTNVEDEWPSKSTMDQEDYFIVTALDLLSKADFIRNTELNLDTGIAFEKHFRRPDLDNSTDPFGRIRVNSMTRYDHFDLRLNAYTLRASESTVDTYVPGDMKRRDVNNQFGYGADLSWSRKSLRLGANYAYAGERHLSSDFKSADQDEITAGFSANWQPMRVAGLFYSYETKNTDLLNNPDDSDWEDTQRMGLLGQLPLLKRPLVTYSLGLEGTKEEKDATKDGRLLPRHTLTANDSWSFPKPHNVLTLTANATYTYKEDYTDNEIDFVYSFILGHQLSRTAKQRLGFERKPVRTLGSTASTDNTTVHYTFTKQDLFVYNLGLSLGVKYSIDEPLDGSTPTEKKWIYDGTLAHTREMTRKLNRVLEYSYHRETSNLETDVLQEHRVSLKFVYTF